MSTQPDGSAAPKATRATVDELFATAVPVRASADLAHAGIFDDDELGEFLADLQALRHTGIA